MQACGPNFFGQQSAAAVSWNPPWENVVLLVHMDGTDGQTTWTDTSNSAHTVSRIGNTVVSDAVTLFGENSTLFDGNGDILSIPDSDDFCPDFEDFVLQVWVWCAVSVVNQSVLGSAVETGYFPYNFSFPVSPGEIAAKVSLHDGGGDVVLTLAATQATISTAAWHLLSMTKVGDTFRWFLDENKIGGSDSVALPGQSIFNAAAPLCIGNYSVDYNAGLGVLKSWNGYMRELRIVNGVGLPAGDTLILPTGRFPDA